MARLSGPVGGYCQQQGVVGSSCRLLRRAATMKRAIAGRPRSARTADPAGNSVAPSYGSVPLLRVEAVDSCSDFGRLMSAVELIKNVGLSS